MAVYIQNKFEITNKNMTEEQRKAILVETVREYGSKEWFRDATVWDHFPTTNEPMLELKVNYVPVFERKYIIEFAARHGLREKYTIVDRRGNPVE